MRSQCGSKTSMPLHPKLSSTVQSLFQTEDNERQNTIFSSALPRELPSVPEAPTQRLLYCKQFLLCCCLCATGDHRIKTSLFMFSCPPLPLRPRSSDDVSSSFLFSALPPNPLYFFYMIGLDLPERPLPSPAVLFRGSSLRRVMRGQSVGEEDGRKVKRPSSSPFFPFF